MANDDLLIRVRMTGTGQAAAEARVLSRSIDDVGDKAARTERRSRGLGRGFVYARKGLGPLRAGVTGLAGALGFTGALGLAGAFKVAYTEARESQKVNRATAAVLHSTGGAANISAKGVDHLATRLSNLSGIDDEVVAKSENMLLTFRNIRNEGGRGGDIFDQTAKAAVNMSAAFEAAGKSLSPTDAALQLGKAINDPIKGMTRLQRVGVTFSDQQVELVKRLQESGDMMGAQRVILRELRKEFGGQAKSQADPITRMSTTFHNLAENIGALFLPAIDRFANRMSKLGRDLQAIWGQKGVSVGDKIRESLMQAFGPKTTGDILKIAGTIKRIAQAAWPVVRAFGRITKGVVEFFSHHPDLVKIAAAGWLIRKAFLRLGGGAVLSAVGALITKIRLLRKTGNTVKVAEGVAMNLGKMPKFAAGPLARFKTFFVTAMRSIGVAGGIALALAIAYEVLKHHKQIEDAVKGDPNAMIGPSAARFAADFNRQVVRPTRTGTPGASHGPQSRPQDATRHGPSASPKRVATIPAPSAVPGGGVQTGDIVVHQIHQLDGKTLYESTTRHARNRAARR